MPAFASPEGGQVTWISATGTVAITSAFAQIIGFMAQASATAGTVQFFASTTTSASMTPVLQCQATGNFIRFPAVVSGQGLTLKYINTLDPNLLLFWLPIQ